MTRPLLALLCAVTLAAGLAACGGSEPGGAGGGPEPPTASDVLSVEEAIASGAEGHVTVRGFLVAADGEPVRLCAALAESYPPQCGVASIVVEGLDLATVDGLTTPPEPQYAHTSWTDAVIELRGELEDGVLTVGETVG
jgi:hypothetical protein